MADINSMSSYNYNIKATYIGGSTTYTFRTENIKSLIIDHDYDNNCMPTLYMNLMVDRRIIDDMIKNQNQAYFILTVNAVNSTSSFGASSTSIQEKCVYFLTDDLNKTDVLDYGSEDNKNSEVLAPVSIGLLSADHIKNNKKSCGMTVRETTPQDIVKEITSHMKNVIIEPFEYNDQYPSIIIPPNMADTVNKTLQYLNNQKVFYSTPYRFYQDFNNTFIISSSGKGVSSSGSGSGGLNGAGSDSINITVSEVDDLSTTVSGILNNFIGGLLNNIGGTAGSIVSGLVGGLFGGGGGGLFGGGSSGQSTEVGVNYADMQVFDNTISNKKHTKIRGMNSIGMIETQLASQNEVSTGAYLTKRFNNDNIHMMENIEADRDSNNFFIFFNKVDLDNTVFSINKQIKINNTQRYQELNGSYLLYRKKELYTRQETDFILNSLIYLKRIDGAGNSRGSGSSSGSNSFCSFGR